MTTIEQVVNSFLNEAEKALDFKLILKYQWSLNAEHGSNVDVLDAFRFAKANVPYKGE